MLTVCAGIEGQEFKAATQQLAEQKQQSSQEAGFVIEFVVPGGGIEPPTRSPFLPRI